MDAEREAHVRRETREAILEQLRDAVAGKSERLMKDAWSCMRGEEEFRVSDDELRRIIKAVEELGMAAMADEDERALRREAAVGDREAKDRLGDAPDLRFYVVDGTRYETSQEAMTGAVVKARIVGLDPSYGLILEGHGDDPDRLVGDDETVRFEKGGLVRRFTTVPPATFGWGDVPEASAVPADRAGQE